MAARRRRAATREQEIARRIAGGADVTPETGDGVWPGAPAPSDGTESVALRVDAEVLAWFRAQGGRYRSSMSDVLRAHVERRRRARA